MPVHGRFGRRRWETREAVPARHPLSELCDRLRRTVLAKSKFHRKDRSILVSMGTRGTELSQQAGMASPIEAIAPAVLTQLVHRVSHGMTCARHPVRHPRIPAPFGAVPGTPPKACAYDTP